MPSAQAVSRSAPQGTPVTGPQAWYGAELAKRRDEWCHTWSTAEVAEIEAAATGVLASNRPIIDITHAHFPLPTISRRLADARRYLLDGPGLFLFRGLPVDSWSMEQAATAFWGLGTHLGEACSQNGKGHVLGHVTNLGLDYRDPRHADTRPTHGCHTIRIPATSSACSVSAPPAPAGSRPSSPRPRSTTRCCAAAPIFCPC